MSHIPELLDSLRQSLDDIERAIKSHFIVTKDVPLSEYGDLIRSIKRGQGGSSSAAMAIRGTIKTGARVVRGNAYNPVEIVNGPTRKMPKHNNAFMVYGIAPTPGYIEGYEPVDLATLPATLELTDDNYDYVDELNDDLCQGGDSTCQS